MSLHLVIFRVLYGPNMTPISYCRSYKCLKYILLIHVISDAVLPPPFVPGVTEGENSQTIGKITIVMIAFEMLLVVFVDFIAILQVIYK